MSADVVLRYWAGAKAAAGVESETFRAGSLADALDRARSSRADDPGFARVLAASSILVDGVVVTTDRLDEPVDHDLVAEILPPFAGGSQHVDLRLAR